MLIQLIIINSYAQDIIFESRHIGTKEGINSRFVFDTEKDQNGNLWIGTNQGFNVFDGHKIENLSNDKLNKKNGVLSFSIMDSNGLLWRIFRQKDINTKEFTSESDLSDISNFQYTQLNVSIYDPYVNSTQTFNEFFQNKNLKIEDVWDIKETKLGILINCGEKVFLYTKTLNEICIPTKMEESPYYIQLMKNGNRIFYKKNELSIYDSNCNFIKILDYKKQKNVAEIYIDEQEGMWLLSSIPKGYCIELFQNIDSKPIVSELIIDKHPSLLNNLEVSEFAEDLVFVRTKKKVRIYNKKTLALVNNLEFNKIFKDKNISIFDIDKYHNNYILSTSEGVYIINPKSKNFKQHFSIENSIVSMRGITVDSEGHLIANSYNGLCSENSTFAKNIGDNIFMNFGTPLYYDSITNSVYKGYHSENYDNYNLGDNTLTNFALKNLKNEISFFHRSIHNNKLYLGSSEGLHRLNTNNNANLIKEINQFMHADYLGLKSITEYKDILWLTGDLGLISYNLRNKNVKSYPLNYNNSTLKELTHLHIQNDSIFWITSIENGLLKWNKKTSTLEVFDTKNGLSNNKAHAVFSDNENLWISTNYGLNRLNLNTEKITSFYEEDGISNNEFNEYSYYQKPDGTIYFGGLNGINEINPSKFKANNSNRTKIQNVLVQTSNNKEKKIYNPKKQSSQIYISNDEKNVVFKIIPENLLRTDFYKYSYRIKSSNLEWQDINQNEITFANLPHGQNKIEFKLKKDNRNEVTDIFSLNVEVEKPLYLKDIFLFLGSILCAILFLIITKLRNNYFIKRELKLQKVIEEKTADLQASNDSKNKLFSILAHDLRNPIASLSNITNKVKYLISNNETELLDKLTQQIEHKLQNLNRNLDNILNYALSDDNKIPYNPQILLIHDQCKSILSLFSEFIAQKKLSFNISCVFGQEVYADETSLQTILRNLIHNAIKFSEDHEIIQINIKKFNSNSIEIDFVNTVNEQNFNKEKGMGLGLNIVKELAVLNKGDFKNHLDKSKNLFIAKIILPFKT